MNRSRIAKTNRTKGHNYERKLTNLYKEAGFIDALTSRNCDRVLDSCKVDIAKVPFYPQCKAGYPAMSVNDYIKIFMEMDEKLKAYKMPLEPFIIHHRKGRKKYHDLTIIPTEHFFLLIKKIISNVY